MFEIDLRRRGIAPVRHWLIKNDPSQEKFEKGWMRRLGNFR
jgi:hypothetical protein